MSTVTEIADLEEIGKLLPWRARNARSAVHSQNVLPVDVDQYAPGLAIVIPPIIGIEGLVQQPTANRNRYIDPATQAADLTFGHHSVVERHVLADGAEEIAPSVELVSR